ncbi:MAG: hypothetical protein MJK04_07805, partial [Psychrosphaera sp.]|nr:hypothetical protein [Psychrosphaera sp.]
KQTVGSLKWDTQITVDDSHATAAFVGTYLALKRLYTNWDAPSKHSKSGVKAYLHQYQLLSDDFGYRIIPGEYRLRYMGTDYFMANEIEKATEVFKINSQLYPYSAMAHDNYAEALETQGLLEHAMEEMEQAMSLLKGKQDPNYKAISVHYDKVKKLHSQGNK